MTKYLIDFHNTASREDVDQYFIDNSCNIITEFVAFDKVFHVECGTEPPKTDIVSVILNDELLGAVKPLEIVTIPKTPSDGNITIDLAPESNWWKVYSINTINLDEPHVTIPRYGQNVTVYVVDSGIDISHPEFTNKPVSLLYSFTGDFTDTKGHGTAISSLIVGDICGISSPNLKVVKIFDTNVETKLSDLLAAFDAIYRDSILSPKLSVVNLSWCIPRNPYVEDKIRTLIRYGVVVCAAAGNSGVPIEDVTPAAMPEVCTVGAYSSSFIPCDFSDYTDPTVTNLTLAPTNHGSLDAWAPGEKIWVAHPGGQYGMSGGTSLATAIYSSSVAYNLSQFLNENNSVMSHYRNGEGDSITNESMASFDRSGILNLSDPKYSASVNLICTFNNEPRVPGNSKVVPMKIGTTVNTVRYVQMFSKIKTTSYEVLATLPDFVKIEQNIMRIAPVTEPDPGGATGVQFFDIPYRIYPSDGSEVYETMISVVVIGSKFDVTTLPPDDPIVKIVLLVPCGSTYSPFCFTGVCSPGLFCTTTPAKSINCGCYAP